MSKKLFLIALFVVSFAAPGRAQETPRESAKNIFDGAALVAQNAPPEALRQAEAKTELTHALLNAHLEQIPLSVKTAKEVRTQGGWYYTGGEEYYGTGKWVYENPSTKTVYEPESINFTSFKALRKESAILDMDGYAESEIKAAWTSLKTAFPSLKGHAESGKIYLEAGSFTLDEFHKLKNVNIRALITAAYLARNSRHLKDDAKKEIYKNLDSRAAWALSRDKVITNKKPNESGDKNLQTTALLTRSEYESFKKALGQ